MTHACRTGLWLGLLSVAAACGTSGGTTDAGTPDAGPPDAGWTPHAITFGTPYCVCPGQTAADLTSAPAGATAVEWSSSFPSVTLGAADQLTLDLDFSGPTSWTIGLLDMPGHVGFPTSMGPPLTSGTWNCIHVLYDPSESGYTVWVNQRATNLISATLPMTVAGIDVDYSGNAMSSAWLDSVQVTQLPGDGGTPVTLLSQSFDDPISVPSGLLAGSGGVATPPASLSTPPECESL